MSAKLVATPPAPDPTDPREHPDRRLLEGLLRGELPRADARTVVRHLLAGCPRCSAVLRPILALGDEALWPLEPPAPKAAGQLRLVRGLPR